MHWCWTIDEWRMYIVDNDYDSFTTQTITTRHNNNNNRCGRQECNDLPHFFRSKMNWRQSSTGQQYKDSQRNTCFMCQIQIYFVNWIEIVIISTIVIVFSWRLMDRCRFPRALLASRCVNSLHSHLSSVQWRYIALLSCRGRWELFGSGRKEETDLVCLAVYMWSFDYSSTDQSFI